jgi:hypothetical protein
MEIMENYTFRSSLNPLDWVRGTRRGFGIALIAVGSFGTFALSAHAQDAPPAQEQAAGTGDRSDGQIEMDVVHALDASADLKQDWITAATVQGEVTLSGTSASANNRQLAESIATRIPGVTKVVNTLKVGDPQTAAAEMNASAADQNDPGQDPAEAQNQQAPPPQYPAQHYPAQQGQPQMAPGAQANGGYDDNAPFPGQQRPMYRSAPPANYPQGPEPPHTPVTLTQGTLLSVRTSEPLDNKKAKEGTAVDFTVTRDVYAAGVLAIPRGATVHGVVTKSKNAGAVGGAPELALKVTALDMGGQSYPLDTDAFDVKGPSKTGRTVGNAVGGAIFGALIGGAVGGGGGAAIGAAAGGVGGTAASAATPGPRVWIPTEAMISFHLATPITVTPVSRAEAARLAANAQPNRPTLYRRYPYGYPYGYPPPPPPGYYYRPY